MSGTVTINLSRPVASVKILDNYPDGSGTGLSGDGGMNSAPEGQVRLVQDLEREKAAVAQVCQTLNGLADKLSQLYDKLLAEHKEEVAKLSVEIARKILVQKVQKGDYEIESIVEEALKNAPSRQDVVVHLNPEDLAACQKVQADVPGSSLAGIKLVADPNMGRAECLLESPKGIIKSFIDEQIERIGEALEKVE